MQVTEIRIKLANDWRDGERLLAYASITLDGMFVVRDLKIVDGKQGAFIAFPSRKLMDRCRACGRKNDLMARFCNECGIRLPATEDRTEANDDGRYKLHADVAHPANNAARDLITRAVLAAYYREVETEGRFERVGERLIETIEAA